MMWWGALAAAMLGGCAGGWIGVGMKWQDVAGDEAIARGVGIGFGVAFVCALIFMWRTEPVRLSGLTHTGALAFGWAAVSSLPLVVFTVEGAPVFLVLFGGVWAVAMSAALTIGSSAFCEWVDRRNARTSDNGSGCDGRPASAVPYDHETMHKPGWGTPTQANRPPSPAAYDRAQARTWLRHTTAVGANADADRAEAYRAPTGAFTIGGVG